MLGWFRKSVPCPVDALAKEWIEDRWSWLTKTFGGEYLRSIPDVLPIPEFFPDSIEKTTESIDRLIERIAGMMHLPSGRIIVEYIDVVKLPIAGAYEARDDGKFAITINLASAFDAESLIATVSHELAHIHLLGYQRVSPEEPDHEILTDLACIAFGFGVFSINAIHRTAQWNEGLMTMSQESKSGYLNINEFAYAMALRAKSFGHPPFAAANYLRQDAVKALTDSMKYLDQERPPEATISCRRDGSNIRFMMMGRKRGMSFERLQFVYDAIERRNDYLDVVPPMPLTMHSVCRLVEQYAVIEFDIAAQDTLEAWELTNGKAVHATLAALCSDSQIDSSLFDLSGEDTFDERLHFLDSDAG